MRTVLLAALIAGCNPSAKEPIGQEGIAPTASVPVSTGSAAPLASAREVGKPRMTEAAQDEGAASIIRTERLKAKAEGRVLVVYVGATWCEPCRKFKEELRSGRLDERLANVNLLAFDADRDLDRLGAAGYTFKFVPFVALPGADGRPSDTQEANGKGGQAWRELLAKLDAWQR